MRERQKEGTIYNDLSKSNGMWAHLRALKQMIPEHLKQLSGTMRLHSSQQRSVDCDEEKQGNLKV